MGDLTNSSLLEIRKRKDQTIWRWFEFFPVENRAAIVSLGEGYTPLVQSFRLSEKLGLPRLHLKNDTLLPTGSLKDRSNSVGLSRAKELGFATAAVISTGNAAASVGAYAAAAGLKSVVMVPEGTSSSKVLQAVAYGATEICMQSGIHPDWTIEDYERWLRIAKEEAPQIHLHAYSPMEVDAMAGSLPLGEVFARLRDAGLGSTPGTAAARRISASMPGPL